MSTEITRIAHLEATIAELLKVTAGFKDWIHAVPEATVASLPAMPGMDGDWATEVIDNAKMAISDPLPAATHQLMPIEPTKEILEAMLDAAHDSGVGMYWEELTILYRASMNAAAKQ